MNNNRKIVFPTFTLQVKGATESNANYPCPPYGGAWPRCNYLKGHCNKMRGHSALYALPQNHFLATTEAPYTLSS